MRKPAVMIAVVATGLVLVTSSATATVTVDPNAEGGGGNNPNVTLGVETPGSRSAPPRSGGDVPVGGGVSRGGGGGDGKTGIEICYEISEAVDGPSPETGAACGSFNFDSGLVPVPGRVATVVLAQRASDRIDLVRPRLGTAPPAPADVLVGIPTWLWVSPDQWRTLQGSASAGGTTVTASATPVGTRWDMGEGVRHCRGSGRVWRAGLGDNARSSCQYTYRRTSKDQSGGTYAVSAVIVYQIDWTCRGDCDEPVGTLGTMDSPPSTRQLGVVEAAPVLVK